MVRFHVLAFASVLGRADGFRLSEAYRFPLWNSMLTMKPILMMARGGDGSLDLVKLLGGRSCEGAGCVKVAGWVQKVLVGML